MNRVVFEGYDNNGKLNLWVTDGTSTGTRELTVTGANSSGLFYNISPSASFTRYGTKVLFKGNDASGSVNLLDHWRNLGGNERTNTRRRVLRRLQLFRPKRNS